ncbi:hypothetical protein VNI00_006846 [Paramarasmius palmivorus]|uniref:Uncharacterized protein n=1 Tax=Paramarasmius palmivorus TaxID=297713 RepID=A0AAW0D804_9AGAR
MGNSTSSQTSGHHTKIILDPTEENVVAVRLILLDHLPRELVDVIIDDAQYWPRIRVERSLIVTATAMDNADWCYLVTPRLFVDAEEDSNADEADLKRPRRINSVTFTTKSHDQGWGGPPRDEMERYGPHHGSFSWFEAMIIRQSEKYPNAPWWLETFDLPVDLQDPVPSDRELSEADAVTVGPPRKRWFVLCNQTANREFLDHTVTWTIDDEDPLHTIEDSLRGHVGMSKKFLDLLRAGDRIALMVRAMVSGQLYEDLQY